MRSSKKKSGSGEQELASILWPDPEEAPTRLVTCRHCGKRNRVSVPEAVTAPEDCDCGACQKALFIPKAQALEAISSNSYEHSLDRAALAALKAIPAFPAAVRWLMANVGERSLRILAMSNHVLCGPEQFPELLALLDQARHRLDIPYQPSLFLAESPVVNASTMGAEDPLIVVYAATLDQLEDAQVVAMLAHELGHLHADHSLYRMMATLLMQGSTFVSGIGRILTIPLQKALYKWFRCSELTADRAGLLGCRDLGASLTLLMNTAGGNRPGTTLRTRMKIAPFIAQARALAEMEGASWLDSMLAMLLTMDSSHPFIAWRVMHLLQWVEDGNYLDILAGNYERVKRGDAQVA